MQRVKEKGYAMVGDVYESKISSYGQSLMLNNHYPANEEAWMP